jgi:GNAT superfamily N-acetyltransferase
MVNRVINPHTATRRTMPRLLAPVGTAYGAAVAHKRETPGQHTREVFRIRPATMADMPSIIGLISESAEWLQTEKKSDQWQRPWPDEAGRDQRIRRGIKVGRTWMVESDGELVGTVSCGRGGNKKLWKQRERNQSAVYVSRLVVIRRHSGKAIGASLIDWAGQRGVRIWGAVWIRIDVWTTNRALHHFYQSQGFAHVRTCDFGDPWEYPSAVLFQKPTAHVTSGATTRFWGECLA